MKYLSIFALFLVTLTLSEASWGSKKDRVKLKDITTLTLYHGQWTTGRRTRPVPMLQCIGGTAMCKFLPKTVQCYNRGSDGIDVQWECKADIPSNMRFNKIEVTCEGYDFPEDDYVLKGSCGLEYSLDTTDGSRPFPEPHFDRPDPRNIPKSHQKPIKKDEASIGTVMVLGAMSAVMWLIYKCCLNPGVPRESRSRPSAPPSAPPPPGFKPNIFSQTEDISASATQDSAATGGNFWPGVGLGLLTGYLFGNRGTGTTTQEQQYARTSRREYVNEQPNPPYPTTPTGSSGGWFSGWSSGTRQRRSEPSPPKPSPSTSGEVSRNASGFGGTKRR